MPLQYSQWAKDVWNHLMGNVTLAPWLAAGMHLLNYILPNLSESLVFGLFNNYVLGFSSIKKMYPIESRPKTHLLLCACCGAFGAFIAFQIVPKLGLTVMLGSFMFFHDLVPSAIQHVKSDEPPGLIMVNYTTAKYTFVAYVCTGLVLKCLSRMPVEVLVAALDIAMLSTVCVAGMAVYKFEATTKAVMRLATPLLSIILQTPGWLFNTKDVVENFVIFHVPKLISKPWEIRDSILIRWIPMPRFIYKEFETGRTIRLLKLEQKGIFSGAPRCSIQELEIDKEPLEAYEALSYRWGSANSGKHIFIDGAVLPVTDSAYELVQARSSFWRSRLVWIDAICIYSIRSSIKNLRNLRSFIDHCKEPNRDPLSTRNFSTGHSVRQFWDAVNGASHSLKQ